jgi:hypothetical protein
MPYATRWTLDPDSNEAVGTGNEEASCLFATPVGVGLLGAGDPESSALYECFHARERG